MARNRTASIPDTPTDIPTDEAPVVTEFVTEVATEVVDALPAQTEEQVVEAAMVAATSATAIDHSCHVYRDNSGKALGGGVSEGAANFGAITAAARSLVDNGTPNETA